MFGSLLTSHRCQRRLASCQLPESTHRYPDPLSLKMRARVHPSSSLPLLRLNLIKAATLAVYVPSFNIHVFRLSPIPSDTGACVMTVEVDGWSRLHTSQAMLLGGTIQISED